MARARKPDIPTVVSDEGPLHTYRTEIPNTIIKGIRSQGLSIYAKWLYVFLKSVTGDNGTCTYGVTAIARITGMARGQVVKARNELKNKGLIRVKQGRRTNRDTLNIRIIDIWPENMQEFSVHITNTEDEREGKEIQEVKLDVFTPRTQEFAQCSPHEHSVHHMNTSVHHMNTGRSISGRSIQEEDNPPLLSPPLEKSSKRSRRKKQGSTTPLPNDFTITDTMRAWGREHFPDIDLDATTEAWLDGMRAKGFQYQDWEAGWRNGIRKAVSWKTAVLCSSAKPFADMTWTEKLAYLDRTTEKLAYLDRTNAKESADDQG